MGKPINNKQELEYQKEIAKLEEIISNYQLKEERWSKEQTNLITLSKKKESRIESLLKTIDNLTNEWDEDKIELKALKKEKNDELQSVKDLKQELEYQGKLIEKKAEELKIKDKVIDNLTLQLKKEKKPIDQYEHCELVKNYNNLEEKYWKKKKEILELRNELKTAKEKYDILFNKYKILEENKEDVESYANRDTVINILHKSMSDDEIQKNFGNVYDGWLEDPKQEILTKEQKYKIKVYDELQNKDLLADWQTNMNKLTLLSKWELCFPNRQPEDVKKLINELSDDSKVKKVIKNKDDEINKLKGKLQKIREHEN